MNNYHGDVIVKWWGRDYYLRNDLATGCREPEDGEAYSLFQMVPYMRMGVYAGRLDWAIRECEAKIERQNGEPL